MYEFHLGISASFFKIKLNIMLDTLIQKIFFEIIKINNFRGELTDNSAKKEALIGILLCRDTIRYMSSHILRGYQATQRLKITQMKMPY